MPAFFPVLDYMGFRVVRRVKFTKTLKTDRVQCVNLFDSPIGFDLEFSVWTGAVAPVANGFVLYFYLM